MRILYTFSIYIYSFLVRIASFRSEKAKKWVLGRKNQQFPSFDSKKKVYWFHCASLGEFDQGLPLMNRLKEHEECILLVTFFSPSGYEHYHKRKQQVDFACYLPIDTPRNAQRFITHFNPTAAFFVKYEFWSNYIFAAKKSGIKLYSICAIFRENHRFFKWYGSFFRKTLRQFHFFYVQTQESIQLLHSIGIDAVLHVGDMRFDRVISNKKDVQQDSILSTFTQEEKVWVIGSSWPVDETFLSTSIETFTGKIILAPHDISEQHIVAIEHQFKGKTVRYSSFDEYSLHCKILILDCIGKLANAYSYGNFAYVGGGFTGSLHNILEPAVFGLPVLFGPKHSRFPEAQLFIESGIGFSIKTKEDLDKSVSFIESHLEELRVRTSHIVSQNAGVAEQIHQHLRENGL